MSLLTPTLGYCERLFTMTISIPLCVNQKRAGLYETIISDEDKEFSGLVWNIVELGNGLCYAIRQPRRKDPIRAIYLHRMVLEAMLGYPLKSTDRVDHINHNGLDNRRENLRLATHQQNSFNMRTPKNNKSGVRGVSWHKYAKKWRAYITVNNKQINLGCFTELADACSARRNAEIQYFGEFS